MRKSVILFMLISLIMSGLMAFFVTYPQSDLLQPEFTVAYFVDTIFENSLFMGSVLSSLLIGLCCAVISTAIGFGVGRGISKIDLKRKKMLVIFFTLPVFFLAIGLVILIHMVMLRLGMVTTIFGVIVTNVMLIVPCSISIGVSLFSSMPKEFETVSEMLGVGKINTLLRIVFPLVKEGMGLSVCLTFLICLINYFAILLLGGGEVLSIAGILYPYIADFDLINTVTLGMIFLSVNLFVFGISNIWIRKHSYLC